MLTLSSANGHGIQISIEIMRGGAEKYVSHLATKDILSLIGRREVYALTAVCHRQGQRKSVGFMMFSWLKNGELILRWLYVGSEYRRYGIAGILLDVLFETADRLGAKISTLPLFDGVMGDGTAEQLAEYLTGRGFTDRSRTNAPWLFQAAEVFSLDYFKKAIEDDEMPKGVRSIAALTEEERYSMIHALAPEHAKILRAVDERVSCVVGRMGAWKGCCLVGRRGDIYEPCLARIGEERRTETLLLLALAQLLSEYMQMGEYLWIDDSDEEMEELVAPLFEGLKKGEAIRLTRKDVKTRGGEYGGK